MSSRKKCIGIMGGTFDPIHNAHLTLAVQAYEQFGLDEVWILPNGNPPHKRDTTQAEVVHRMEMIRLAIRDIPGLRLCDMESSGETYHYTYETLQQLNARFPNTEFYFIMGADSLFEFDSWREPGRISRECVILAATRDHCRREEIKKRIQELKSRYGADIRILDTPNMDIASEDIREMIADGERILDIVPPAVADYIRQNGLYHMKTAAN